MIGALLIPPAVAVALALALSQRPAPPRPAVPPAPLKLLETEHPTPAQRVMPGLR